MSGTLVSITFGFIDCAALKEKKHIKLISNTKLWFVLIQNYHYQH